MGQDSGAPVPNFREIADGALLARFPEASEREANHAAVALSAAAMGIDGVLGAIPGARSLLMIFEPAAISGERLASELARVPAGRHAGRREPVSHRRLRIPVLYGGDAGPDLAELAMERRISADFAALHASAEYEVAFVGFSPGFGYLTGLPEELWSPRLSTPRTRVPAGSVAIGGPYTGIYPSETPGGWRLIGRTPVRLFDPDADPPALLSAGDRVRFESIDPDQFERALARQAEQPRPRRPAAGKPILKIASPGVWTTVQGEPRYRWSGSGVPPGGALDLEGLAAGNRALGNLPFAPALEMSLVGPELEALSDIRAVIAGSAAAAERNRRPLAAGGVFGLAPGDRLHVGLLSSARAYLCIAGGICRPAGAVGSIRLASGDVVCAPEAGENSTPLAPRGVPPAPRSGPVVVRVVLGPDEDRFSQEGIGMFLAGTYRVSAASDRRGIRLEGPPVRHSGAADVAPEATPLGGVQVAKDGQPIVLGPDRPVTGGYARIATVIGADFPLLARVFPGTAVRFRSVHISEALEARSKLPALSDPERPSRKERA